MSRLFNLINNAFTHSNEPSENPFQGYAVNPGYEFLCWKQFKVWIAESVERLNIFQLLCMMRDKDRGVELKRHDSLAVRYSAKVKGGNNGSRYDQMHIHRPYLFLSGGRALMDVSSLPAEPCQVQSDPSWSDQEKWAWQKICLGQVADFNKAEGYGGELDPKKPEGWPESRILRPSFLETILLREPFRGALTRHGLCITGCWFNEPVDLSNASLAQHLALISCWFNSDINFSYLKTSHLISLRGSKFTGKLNMNLMRVENHLFMSEGAEFAEVDLIGAKVGALETDGSIFTHRLYMDSLQVRESLLMRNTEVRAANPVKLIFAQIGGYFDLRGSTLTSLDLTGTRIRGGFNLGSGKQTAIRWRKKSKLTLCNTKVGVLQDFSEAWPDSLELDGFSYVSLGGLAGNGTKSMANRQLSWIKEWLEKDEKYSSQPYTQLSKILDEAGYKAKAKDVLFTGKERERGKARGLNWLNLTLQFLLIGYGYRFYYTFFWVVALCLSGLFVLLATGQRMAECTPFGWVDSIFYSLDMLLPIVKLDESHYAIKLVGFARYYFYIHILLGYVLASFLIAGLSGITKK